VGGSGVGGMLRMDGRAAPRRRHRMALCSSRGRTRRPTDLGAFRRRLSIALPRCGVRTGRFREGHRGGRRHRGMAFTRCHLLLEARPARGEQAVALSATWRTDQRPLARGHTEPGSV
jgi:hypothetical protein